MSFSLTTDLNYNHRADMKALLVKLKLIKGINLYFFGGTVFKPGRYQC